MAQDQELESLEAIYEALDRDDPESALALARQAQHRADEADPVLVYLAGRALFELQRPDEAAVELGRAVELDPDDPEFRAYCAWALYRACRFDEAEAELKGALDPAHRLPEPRYVLGLLLERRGRMDEADRQFERAERLDPEGFPKPTRFSDVEFERQLRLAREGLAEPFRAHLDEVGILVDDVPPESLLTESGPPLDPEQLLGLFVGVPLDQQSVFSPGGELPARIHLFKRNLERYAATPEELAEQIRVTLYHELGHYLGMDEDELEDLGYG